MGSQTSPYFEFSSVLYLGFLFICINETLAAIPSWPANGQQPGSQLLWNPRPLYNQQYQYQPSQNRIYPRRSAVSFNRPNTAPNTYYRNSPAITPRSTYPYRSSSIYGRFPQQQRWGGFPAFLPPMRRYQQANRLEHLLPRPSGDRNVPLTPAVMRMLGMNPNGHMMNRLGMNQPYGPDRTVGGITIDGSDVSYA